MSNEKDILILCQRVNSLEINSEDHNRRLNELEHVRDEKVEPVSPSIEWYAHQHHQLSRENELLKHDIQCFKDDYANGHKIRMDLTNKLIKERDYLSKTVADKQKVLEDVMDQRDRFSKANYDLNKTNQMLKGTIKNHEDRVLERSRIILELEKEQASSNEKIDAYKRGAANCKQVIEHQALTINMLQDKVKEHEKVIEYNEIFKKDKLQKENEILKEDVAGAHAKVKELESLIENYQTGAMGIRKRILELEDDNKEQLNLIKLYEATNADMAKKIKELEKPYAPKFTDYDTALKLLAKKDIEIDDLNKRLDFFEKKSYDLEMEKKDAKWYKEQAIEECIFIVDKIKNDPLTSGEGKRWIVAACQDIQRAIENKFETGWKLSNE